MAKFANVVGIIANFNILAYVCGSSVGYGCSTQVLSQEDIWRRGKDGKYERNTGTSEIVINNMNIYSRICSIDVMLQRLRGR